MSKRSEAKIETAHERFMQACRRRNELMRELTERYTSLGLSPLVVPFLVIRDLERESLREEGNHGQEPRSGT